MIYTNEGSKLYLSLCVIAGVLLLITLSVNIELSLIDQMVVSSFKGGLTSISFSAYVVGLVPTIIFLAGLSDAIGIRLVLTFSCLLVFFSISLIAIQPGFVTLVISRGMRGVAVGLTLGATASAFVGLMLNRKLATMLHGCLVPLGLGSGTILTIVSPNATGNVPISFVVVLLLSLIFLGLLYFIVIPPKASVSRRIFSRPYFSRDLFRAYLGIFLAWSWVGVMITVVFGFLSHKGSHIIMGILVFLSVGIGGVAQLGLHLFVHKSLLNYGKSVLVLSVVVLYIGIQYDSAASILISSALCGVSCLGFIYLGGLSEVMNHRSESESRAVSGYVLCGYIGLGGPCVFAGFLSDIVGPKETVVIFSVLMVVAIAMTFLLSRFRKISNVSKCFSNLI